MPRLLVRHKVADYGKWKPLFDAHAAKQRAAGITGGRLFRNADDPQEVVILFKTDDLEATRRFVQSEDLKETMEKAGVIDKPDVYFLEEVSKFNL